MYIFFDMDFNIFVENDDWINVGMLYWLLFLINVLKFMLKDICIFCFF